MTKDSRISSLQWVIPPLNKLISYSPFYAAKAVNDETKDIVKKAEASTAAVSDPAKKQQLLGVAKALDSNLFMLPF